MSDIEFEQVFDLAMQLSPTEQEQLIQRLEAVIHETMPAGDAEDVPPAWTDEEIAEMTKIEPLTGAEIVAAGLTGGWADLEISDGAEWINGQKAKRKGKFSW